MKAPPLSILVVEDEPAIRLSVGDALRAAGHRVLICRSGTEALAVLGSRPSQEPDPERGPSWVRDPNPEPNQVPGQVTDQELDLVISDVHLPGAGGLQLFRHVRASSPGTDVILMTSHGGVADAIAALKEGARDYLLKPFDIEELLLRVVRIVEQRQLRQQLLVARSELRTRPEALTSGRPAVVPQLGPPGLPPLGPVGPLSAAMKEFERAYLLHTLDSTQGRKAAAAKQLGISRKNLWEKLRAHGINQPAAGEDAK